MNVLKVGIPKGSLEKATIELFEKSGWKISTTSRNYFPKVDDDPELSIHICRPQEMPLYVEDGGLDAGITGKDWIMEHGYSMAEENRESKLVVIAELNYSKVSRKPTRWVIAVRGDSDITTVEQLKGKRVSTELVKVTENFFKQQNIELAERPKFSWGATEAKVLSDYPLADAIVEITETEATIRAHGLRIIHELMQSNTQFIANRKAFADPWKKEKIQHIATLLQGALRADKIVGLKMNAPEKAHKALLAILPSVITPTVACLHKTEDRDKTKDRVLVETAIYEHQVRDLIPKLEMLGAQGIIEYSLNKVI